MTVNNLEDDLLIAVRQHLRITWPDSARDQRLADLIKDAMSYFQRIAGKTPLTFAPGKPERELLLNYVWYYDNGEGHLFETYYLDRISQFQQDHMVANYEPAEE